MKNRKMKLTSLALAGLITLAACGSGGTYATVNGEKIPQEKYDSQLDLYKNMIAAQYQLPASIKNSLIQEQVMLQDLAKNDVKITDDDYAVEYDKAVQSYGGAQNYSNTLKTLGITDEQLKESLRYETISRKHKEWYNTANQPSDEEIQKYLDENKEALLTVDANHILVDSEDEAKAVKARLDAGEKFEDVAKEVSKDTTSAVNGGALGDVAPSTYVPEFANVVSTMEEGTVSDPVQSQFGWHIIRLNSRKDSVDELKDKIVEALNTEKYNTYVSNLVGAADIQVTGESATTSSAEASSAPAEDSAASGEAQSESVSN